MIFLIFSILFAGLVTPVFSDNDTQAGAPDTVLGRYAVVLSEAATLQDPEEADYDDALVAAVVTITQGPRKGEQIKVVTLGMRKRKLMPAIEQWKNEAQLKLNVTHLLSEKKKAQPDLERTQLIDEVEDLSMVEYWADIMKP